MPYTNIPESDWPKMDRCVASVQAQGHDKESAIAICYTAISGKAGLAVQLAGGMAGASDKALIAFGGEIKAMGDGRVGGYLVRFGNESEPDLSNTRDWFCKSTYFGARNGDGVDTTINHGIPMKSTFASENERRVIEYAAGLILPPIKTRLDDVGIFAETILDLNNEYQAMVAKMIAEKRLLWSSGAVEHLVKRTPAANNTNRVDMWIIGEAAFTPTPAEPRLGPILSLKSLAEYQSGKVLETGSTREIPRPVPIPISLKAQIPRPIPLRIR